MTYGTSVQMVTWQMTLRDPVTVGHARSFVWSFSCVAIDLRSIVFRVVDCRFTVCVFCLRGLLPRPSGSAGAKVHVTIQAAACLYQRACIEADWVEKLSDCLSPSVSPTRRSVRTRSCVDDNVSRSCRTGELTRCRPCVCRCWTECRPELSVNGLTCRRSRASLSSPGRCDGVSWSDGRLCRIVAVSDSASSRPLPAVRAAAVPTLCRLPLVVSTVSATETPPVRRRRLSHHRIVTPLPWPGFTDGHRYRRQVIVRRSLGASSPSPESRISYFSLFNSFSSFWAILSPDVTSVSRTFCELVDCSLNYCSLGTFLVLRCAN